MTSRRCHPALLAGLALTPGLGSLPFPVWLDQFASTRSLLAVEFVYWALAIATLLHVRCIERRWRRDLTTTIVAHILVDAVAVFA